MHCSFQDGSRPVLNYPLLYLKIYHGHHNDKIFYSEASTIKGGLSEAFVAHKYAKELYHLASDVVYVHVNTVAAQIGKATFQGKIGS